MSHWLQVKNIVCRYEPSANIPPVVEDLSFILEVGEIGCLLGSSGCGKTTVLRAIAGFQPINSGSIELTGKLLSSATHHLAPEKRQVGMVFQDYALFPHLSVCQNITFGLHKMSSQARERVCDELLELVKLNGLGHRYPHELSGGQQQRVALARALAPSPALLLLDEPLSSLDAELRRGLAMEVRDILKKRGTSAIMVTHDQEEAFAFADKIGVLHKGKLEQWDVPFNLYHEPKTRYVANFIGQGVFLPGFVRDANTIETELGLLQGHKHYPWLSNTAVEILLRPDDIVESPESP
jgi:iron(III) transport system ATP-binding protein